MHTSANRVDLDHKCLETNLEFRQISYFSSSSPVYFVTPTAHVHCPSNLLVTSIKICCSSYIARLLPSGTGRFIFTAIHRGSRPGSRWLRHDFPQPMPGMSPSNCCTVSCPPVDALLGGIWLPAGSVRCVVCRMKLWNTSLIDVPLLTMSFILLARCFGPCPRTYHLRSPYSRPSSAATCLVVHPLQLSCGSS